MNKRFSLSYYTAVSPASDDTFAHTQKRQLNAFYKRNKSKARLSPGHSYAYFKDDNQLIAITQIESITPCRSITLFRALLVDTQHQQQGIGRQLIQQIKIHTQSSLLCICHEQALGFYQKTGFKEVAIQTPKATHLLFTQDGLQQLKRLGCTGSEINQLEHLMRRASKKETSYLMLLPLSASSAP